MAGELEFIINENGDPLIKLWVHVDGHHCGEIFQPNSEEPLHVFYPDGSYDFTRHALLRIAIQLRTLEDEWILLDKHE